MSENNVKKVCVLGTDALRYMPESTEDVLGMNTMRYMSESDVKEECAPGRDTMRYVSKSCIKEVKKRYTLNPDLHTVQILWHILRVPKNLFLWQI